MAANLPSGILNYQSVVTRKKRKLITKVNVYGPQAKMVLQSLLVAGPCNICVKVLKENIDALLPLHKCTFL